LAFLFLIYLPLLRSPRKDLRTV